MATDPDEYLTPAEASTLTKCALRTLQDYRINGGGPPYVRVGARKVLYQRAAVLAWMQARTFTSTSDEAARQRAAGPVLLRPVVLA